jgi:drug/metabolite transporter (DMT)-like permease
VSADTLLWFGAQRAQSRRWGNPSPVTWTFLGLLAIPLWATWPALALRALQIPAFECLTIAFVAGWLVLRRLETAPVRPETKQLSWSARWTEWLPAFVFALGLTGSNAFHILATHYIPAAEANLLSYLWPVEIIGIGALLRVFRLEVRHVIGLALGVAGALALMEHGGGMTLSFTGIALAVASGLSWALYCVFRLIRREAPARLLQRACLISAMLCLTLHLAQESTIVPDLGALASSAAIGIVPLALGNLAWDQGFRRGDSRLLTVMAYATPLCSALLLIALGLESLTLGLGIGAVLIVLAGCLSRNAS